MGSQLREGLYIGHQIYNNIIFICEYFLFDSIKLFDNIKFFTELIKILFKINITFV